MRDLIRTKWAAVGAAVAVSLGAGGVSLTQAAISSGEKPVFVSLSQPCRVADTRPSTGPIGAKGTPIAAGEANAYEIQITGDSGNCTGGLAVPSDAVAVALNVTAIQPSSSTGRSFFTVYPGDAALPTTSNVNFLSGQAPTPNKVDVGLSATGTIKIYNDAGTSNVAVDIFGYYIDHTHDDRYYTESETDTLLAEKAESMYVMVNSDGSIGRQSGSISVSHTAGSTYFVTFPRDVTSCGWSATLGGDGVFDATLSQLGNQGIAASQGNDSFAVDPDEILVYIWEQDTGSVEDGEFGLVVTCP